MYINNELENEEKSKNFFLRAIFDFFYYWAIKLKFLVQRYLGQLNTTSKLKKYEFLIALEVVFSILGCFRL